MMTLFGKEIGVPSGDMNQDIRTLYDYVAYMAEQLEYSGQVVEKRIAELEEGET